MDDGGRAFPCPTGSDGGALHSGVSLRDYFAGQALIGVLLDPRNIGQTENLGIYAEYCYTAADAMLAERDK